MGVIINVSRFKRENTLREVIKAVLRRDLKPIANKKVLEIGCGTWNYAKRILEKNSCNWFGVELVDEGRKNLTLVKGSVKKLPYHDNSFDFVLCNQTMEHWFEYNVSLKQALSEINRVLKPGGVLMVNSPIHLHGDPRFLSGELEKIRDVFDRKLWTIALFEKCFPSREIKGWKKIASRGFFSRLGYPDFFILHPDKAVSYIINIHARNKGGRLKAGNSSRALRYLTVIFRFFKTYLRTRIISY